MAPVQNLVAQIVYEVNTLEEDNFDFVRKFALSRIDELCRQSVDSVVESAKRGAALIGESGCVASCSYSSTVCETFKIAKQQGKFFEVLVAESRSGDGRFLYGQSLADFLESIDVSVEVFADAEVYRFVPQADCVLVGADSILCDGSVINGSPTYAVAVKAKEHGIPVYSVCETTKANTLSYLGKQVKLKKGFDSIPANLLSAIVTEKGKLDTNKLNDVMKEKSKFFQVFHVK
jgi:translation initiation factor 2B subunit (eIF-2B alpha/beta/delta family)